MLEKHSMGSRTLAWRCFDSLELSWLALPSPSQCGNPIATIAAIQANFLSPKTVSFISFYVDSRCWVWLWFIFKSCRALGASLAGSSHVCQVAWKLMITCRRKATVNISDWSDVGDMMWCVGCLDYSISGLSGGPVFVPHTSQMDFLTRGWEETGREPLFWQLLVRFLGCFSGFDMAGWVVILALRFFSGLGTADPWEKFW